MTIEEEIQKGFFSGSRERSFVDKVLAKDDVNDIRELIKKPELSRQELLEILYLISGSEAKLLNYSEWDRYIILKFFVWIREFIKICEILFDYEDYLKHHDKQLSPRTRRLLNNNKMLLQHNAKFLIDLYLNIARTSMSVGASAFVELLKNKYEVIYPQQQQTTEVKEKTGLLGWRKS